MILKVGVVIIDGCCCVWFCEFEVCCKYFVFIVFFWIESVGSGGVFVVVVVVEKGLFGDYEVFYFVVLGYFLLCVFEGFEYGDVVVLIVVG